MTTEAVDETPISVLQICTKVMPFRRLELLILCQIVFETPSGFAPNFVHSYWTLSESLDGVELERKEEMVGMLCWLHAAIQSQRDRGWSGTCEFTFSDLQMAMRVLAFNDQSKHLQWESVRGLLQTIVYGAVIDDPHDSKVREPHLPLP